MLEVTGGVNTHKGMVYSMGLLACGMGMVLQNRTNLIWRAAKQDTNILYEKAMSKAAASLAGEDIAGRDFGATKEACEGFPNAVYCAERLRHDNSIAETSIGMREQPEITRILREYLPL